ncbi:uncharacterized protein EAF01_010726 [Botrytis porri]|uniref:uncharacterized protein n=1 Tax=Botrytis porri TaxID=87229 RepID=UPI0019017B18|nr:uncharacterized protein EAF01_010726 [Botrytis porri]KAF7890917.1 hypothetical protein EAF01_010726 [Botrytis porri]
MTPSITHYLKTSAALDYGHEVASYPYYDVEFISGKVQIEVKYSEEFDGLNTNFSDGPFPSAIGLSNTYRVETCELTETGPFEAFLLQGGQRWQSIRLLTSGSVTFSTIGFTASVSAIDVSTLPDIWALGARASSLACIDPGTQGSMWEFDANGALVRGMKPGLTIKGASFQNYMLEFNTMIKRGDIGWAIGVPIAQPLGLQLNLIGELPKNTTFVNTNTTLTPPNSLILSYGHSLVNFTTLPSYRLDVFNTPPIRENTWSTVRTILDTADNLAVYIDDAETFNTSLSSYYVGETPIQTTGTLGFGGWQDQGTLNTFLDWQIEDGLLPFSPQIGHNASGAKQIFALGSGATAGLETYGVVLVDYQIFGLISYSNYISSSNDLEFAPDTGIPVFPYSFIGPSQGSAISCALVQALSQLAELWNPTIGVYSLSAASPGDYSIAAIGFCITPGTANTTQALQSLQALEALKLGPGYNDSTQVNSSDPSTNISPNINGFWLAAIIS